MLDHILKHQEEMRARITGSFIDPIEKSKEEGALGRVFEYPESIQEYQAICKSRIASSLTGEALEEEVLEKSMNDYFEKGGRGAAIGEIRCFNGRNYIKTAEGWKFHGTGKGKKASEHKDNALKHHVESSKGTVETDKEDAKKSTNKKENGDSKLLKQLTAAGYSASDAEDYVDEYKQGGSKVPAKVKQILDKATKKEWHEQDDDLDKLDNQALSKVKQHLDKDDIFEAATTFHNSGLTDRAKQKVPKELQKLLKENHFTLAESHRLAKLAAMDPKVALKEAQKYSSLYAEDLAKDSNASRFGKPLTEIKDEYDRVAKMAQGHLDKTKQDATGAQPKKDSKKK